MDHSYRVTADTPQYVQDIGQQKNFKFFSLSCLTESYHTVVVNMTECVNQTFAFDYLTYTYVLPPRRVPVVILNPGDQQMTKTKITLISGNVSGFIILLLLGTIFIVMRRRNRYKHPRRKLTYYLKSFLLLKKPPKDSQYLSLTIPREAPSPMHLMIICAQSQVLCLIRNRKDSHLLMVNFSTQPWTETPSQRALMWTLTPALEH